MDMERNSLSLDDFIHRVQSKCAISTKSIHFLIDKWKCKHWVQETVRSKNILLFSHKSNELKSKSWREMEVTSFMLRATIAEFEEKYSNKIKEES